MADSLIQYDLEPEEPADEIELLVQAAGRYVQPSDDLRPRTLEVARDQRMRQQTQRRASIFFVLLFFIASLGFPGSTFSPLASKSGFPLFAANSHELQMLAARSDSKLGADPSWALMELFFEIRRNQAEMLGRSF